MANTPERDCLLRLCTRPTDKNVLKFLFYPPACSSVVFRVHPGGPGGQMELVAGLVARHCVAHK